MSPFLFWIFAVLTVIFGAAVVINRNPVASALSLVVSFLGLSALFMSIDAFFVGIIQVLVYAGAVMVLYVFVVAYVGGSADPLTPHHGPGMRPGRGGLWVEAYDSSKALKSSGA